MNPLRVSCTTCQARLKVVDPAAVGQILSCPKCGSMVLVEAPPGWSPATSAAAPSGPASNAWKQPVATKTSTDGRDAADSSGVLQPASGSSSGGSVIVGLSARTKLAAAGAAAAARAPLESPAMPQVPPPLGVPEADPPVSRWFWPTMAGVALAGLIGIGILLQLQRRGRNVEAAADGNAQAISPAVIAGAGDRSAGREVRHDAAAVVDSPVARAADGTPHAASRIESPTPTSPSPAVQVAATNPPAPSRVDPPAVSKVEPPVASKAASPAVREIDPATLGKFDRVAPSKPEPPAVSDATSPQPADPRATPPAGAGPAKLPPSATNLPVAPQAHPSLARIPPRDVDVDARLADSLPGVDLQNVPLWRFVSQVSALSTIPITLDVDELAEMNLSVETPVSVRASDATVSGVLDEALTPHGLAPRVVKGQLIVGRAAAAGLRRVRYAVDDLVGAKPSAEQQDQFTKLVHALVAPGSWQEAGGAGTSSWSDGALLVEQSESAHAGLLVLCEKLRVARSLPLRSQADGKQFRLVSRTERAKAALSAQVTANFGHPEPLPHILAYLGEAAHVRLLIDHAALADEQLAGETEACLAAQKLPLGQALAALLEPLELTYRAIDEQTIEITTPRAAARRAELEFYRVAHTPSSDSELVGSVRRQLESAGTSTSLLDGVAMQYDAASRALLVRAPQSVQVQVQAVLGTLRVARQ